MTGQDWAEVAQGIDVMREGLKALVAGLVDDGFTDREAREIIAGMFRGQSPEESA